MKIRPLASALAFAFLPVLALSAGTAKPRKHSSGLVRTAKEAKAIAEQETGGKAVSARRIPLNGASGGWEVEVRMPHEDRGWRCVIDSDTRTVHTKSHIENPGGRGNEKEPSVRMIKGGR
ncbi:MAG TPA: PepSY domain-containing protein [Holophagaceae bacterium]